MLDIEFLSKISAIQAMPVVLPRHASGVLKCIYVYEEGSFRKAMFNAFASVAKAYGKDLGIGSAREVCERIRWQPLFDLSNQIFLGDLDPRALRGRQSERFDVELNFGAFLRCDFVDVVLFIPRDPELLQHPTWREVVSEAFIVEEVKLSRRTLPQIVRYLERASPLVDGSGDGDEAVAYFRKYYDLSIPTPSLSELVFHFDAAVLINRDKGGLREALKRLQSESSPRGERLRPFASFLGDPSDRHIDLMLASVGRRYESGRWNGIDLLRHLYSILRDLGRARSDRAQELLCSVSSLLARLLLIESALNAEAMLADEPRTPSASMSQLGRIARELATDMPRLTGSQAVRELAYALKMRPEFAPDLTRAHASVGTVWLEVCRRTKDSPAWVER